MWPTVPLVGISTTFSGLSERSWWITEDVTCSSSLLTLWGCGVHWWLSSDPAFTSTLQLGHDTRMSPSSFKIKLGAGLMKAESSGVSEKQQGHWEDAETVNQLMMQEAHTTALHGNSTGWDKISKQTGHLRWSIADKVWVSEMCEKGITVVVVGAIDLTCSINAIGPAPLGRPGCLDTLVDLPPRDVALKCSQSCNSLNNMVLSYKLCSP